MVQGRQLRKYKDTRYTAGIFIIKHYLISFLTLFRCHIDATPPMVDAAEFLISYQWLAFLSNFSWWQLIQNSAPSTIVWRQCDIWILDEQSHKHHVTHKKNITRKIYSFCCFTFWNLFYNWDQCGHRQPGEVEREREVLMKTLGGLSIVLRSKRCLPKGNCSSTFQQQSSHQGCWWFLCWEEKNDLARKLRARSPPYLCSYGINGYGVFSVNFHRFEVSGFFVFYPFVNCSEHSKLHVPTAKQYHQDCWWFLCWEEKNDLARKLRAR